MMRSYLGIPPAVKSALLEYDCCLCSFSDVIINRCHSDCLGDWYDCSQIEGDPQPLINHRPGQKSPKLGHECQASRETRCNPTRKSTHGTLPCSICAVLVLSFAVQSNFGDWCGGERFVFAWFRTLPRSCKAKKYNNPESIESQMELVSHPPEEEQEAAHGGEDGPRAAPPVTRALAANADVVTCQVMWTGWEKTKPLTPLYSPASHAIALFQCAQCVSSEVYNDDVLGHVSCLAT